LTKEASWLVPLCTYDERNGKVKKEKEKLSQNISFTT